MTNEDKIKEISFQMTATQILSRAVLFSSQLPFENNYLINDKKVRVGIIQIQAPLLRLVKTMDSTYKTNKLTAEYVKGDFNELDELSIKVLEAAYQIIKNFKREE
jgi:hypothetical protein